MLLPVHARDEHRLDVHPKVRRAAWQITILLACLFSACAGPATPSGPPPSANLSITINSYGDAHAIKGLTAVRFDLSGSKGEASQYALDFGDGMMASEAIAAHVYQDHGSFTVSGTVRDRFDRTANVTATVSVMSLITSNNGWWGAATWESGGLLKILSHEGRQVTGYRQAQSAGRHISFTGTLSGERTLELRLEDGTRLTGAVVLNNQDYRMRLTATGGSDDGRTFEFRYYEQY
jgi:PKD domain-containing protein